MKHLTQSLRWIGALTVLTGVCIFLTSCSADHSSPLSSNNDPYGQTESRYPELTPEFLSGEPVPGFHILTLPGAAAEGRCDSASRSRNCDPRHDRTVALNHFADVTILAGQLHSEETVTIVAPNKCVAVADFYPSHYQFNGPVEITWRIGQMDFPDGFDYSSLVPFYVTDDGLYVEMPYEWRNGYEELVVHTDHFSRYIIGQRAGQ